ncbi:MAG: hypothetical protein H6P94_392, partial [Thermoplasmatales archaeon]|nr:hypothetical protein [Thermoplasmatales archaeon]
MMIPVQFVMMSPAVTFPVGRGSQV